MKKHLTMLATVLLVVTACEFDFVPELDTDAKLFVKCIAVNDSVCLQVKYAAATSYQARFPRINPKTLEVTVGDESMPVKLDNHGNGTLHRHIDAYETVSVRAETIVLGTAYGSTRMPGLPSVGKTTVGHYKVTDSQEYTQIHIDMAEDSDSDDYFAVHVIEEKTRQSADTVKVDTSYIRAMIRREGSSYIEYATLNDNNGLFPFIEAPVIIFPASVLENGNCTLTLLPIRVPPKGTTTSFRYRLLVSKVSKELYLYSMAQYKHSGDILVSLGLAPPQSAWSNIEGGLGVCGAVRTIETDWFE